MNKEKGKKLITIKNKVAKTSTKAKKKAIEKPKKKKKRGKILNFVLISIMLLGITVMGITLAFCAYIVISAPAFNTDLLYNKEATILYDKDGKEIDRIGREQRELKTYEELPEVLIDAIVATEDSRFFQHNGFDIVRFTKAGFGQIAGQSGAGGASTLTMQLVKNTFTSTEAHGIEGIIRKFTDIYMAVFKLEKNYTKEEIMEMYVNKPFMGSNTYGVEQACQVYFGKSVTDISLTEAALIAGIFNAPSSYNPFYSIELSTQRRNTVLNLMVRHGYLTKEQAQDAKDIPVESLLNKKENDTELNKYQSYIDVVVNEVKRVTGNNPYDVPMLIYTTLDPEIQETLNKLNAGELGYKWVNDRIQIGLAITNVKDGSITAINGGRNQTTQRAFNRALSKNYQPGSTIKPIIDYGPYIEYNNGSPGTIFYDIPYRFSNGTIITNSDNGYKGAMTMRQALVQSRNIPALQAFQAVDKSKVAEFVKNCGIDYYKYDSKGNVYDETLYESYAIGGGMEVSPLDMAAAYGTFARGGTYIEPYSFTKIIYEETDEVYERKPEKKQAMSAETAYLINDMLVTATENGVGGNINVPGTQVASKTGTSTYDKNILRANKVPDNASMDNWVLTYSPDYVISFRYGYDKLTHEDWTDAIAAAIQRKKISAVLANKIYKRNSKFTRPSGVVSSKYEKESIPPELPSSYTPANLIGTELFKKGTEPSVISNRFEQLSNPSNVNATESGGSVTITWSAAPKPEAADSEYLKKYFENAYGKDHYKTFYDRRINYNNSAIGNIGYQLYMTDSNGQESDIGFTDGTVYTYNPPTNGSYNFTVRTAYSLYKANQSSGITVNVNVSGGQDITSNVEENYDDVGDSTVPTISINNGILSGDTYNICLSSQDAGGTSKEIGSIINASSNVGNKNIRYVRNGGTPVQGNGFKIQFTGSGGSTRVSVYAINGSLESSHKNVTIWDCNECNSATNTCK